MMMNHFPYPTARECQEEPIKLMEKRWEDFDVFVIKGPVGMGKSGVGVAAQSWSIANGNPCAYIVPNNILRDQLLDDFDHLRTVRSQDKYWLSKYNMTEKEFRKKIYKYGPKGSEYEKDRRCVKRVRTPVVANYHTFIAHKLQRQVLIVDEAHQLLETLKDLHSRRIWRHIHGYPIGARTPSDVLQWIESKGDVVGLLAKLRNSIRSLNEGTVLEMSRDYYRGAMCDCLKLIPLDVSTESPIFWPNKTKKIILMSATIGEEDIRNMGLGTRRVLYIDVDSPIPESQRPVRFVPIADMSLKNQESSIPKIAESLHSLAGQHPEKGFIHATYDIARRLKPYLESNPRFLFHSNQSADKDNTFKTFLQSKDKIMVGSGMYEGIDLKYELASWQVMTKCPYPSLMNPAYRYLAREKPDAYLWCVSKDILQASGRICRSPTDFGVTYLIDIAFERWYEKAKHTLPKWFNMEKI